MIRGLQCTWTAGVELPQQAHSHYAPASTLTTLTSLPLHIKVVSLPLQELMAQGRLQAGHVAALYRAVLRCNAQRLPPPLRTMGDGYARDEFRRHRDAQPPPTEAQWNQFMLEWAKYVTMMEGRGDGASGNIDDSVLSRMSDDQRQRLALLRQEAERLGGKPE